jgi:hypothetical protein
MSTNCKCGSGCIGSAAVQMVRTLCRHQSVAQENTAGTKERKLGYTEAKGTFLHLENNIIHTLEPLKLFLISAELPFPRSSDYYLYIRVCSPSTNFTDLHSMREIKIAELALIVMYK